MSLYQKTMQFLVAKNLRAPITSGDNGEFVKAYRKGDNRKKFI